MALGTVRTGFEFEQKSRGTHSRLCPRRPEKGPRSPPSPPACTLVDGRFNTRPEAPEALEAVRAHVNCIAEALRRLPHARARAETGTQSAKACTHEKGGKLSLEACALPVSAPHLRGTPLHAFLLMRTNYYGKVSETSFEHSPIVLERRLKCAWVRSAGSSHTMSCQHAVSPPQVRGLSLHALPTTLTIRERRRGLNVLMLSSLAWSELKSFRSRRAPALFPLLKCTAPPSTPFG